MDFQTALQRDALIRKEWEKFCRGAAVDKAVVRSEILRGWELFKSRGLDPVDNNIRLVEEEELLRVLHKNTLLLECAVPILKNLFCAPLALRTNITLSDAQGVILYKLAAQLGPPFVTPNFVGCTMSQGLLTCLHEGRPVSLLAAEHFCEPQQCACCHAAPIFNRRGELAGALCFSTLKEDIHYLTASLIEATAQAIGEQLRLREVLEENRVLIELLDKGSFIIDDKGRIQSANKKALSMFDLDTLSPDVSVRDICVTVDDLDGLVRSADAQQEREIVWLQKTGLHFSCRTTCARIASSNLCVLTLSPTHPRKEKSAQRAHAFVTFEQIIGSSPALTQALGLARQAARSDISTLIMGESGTGKELIAQSIHMAGHRAQKPFIVVNCGAIPRDLVESILFGHEGGAFTGASKTGQAGKFEQAHEGTLFLDEIGEMPLQAQTSLLRLLQNKEVVRVGGLHRRVVDVRIIAATNKNLAAAVQSGAFREDLYYRLLVFPIVMPPLRHRPQDIEILVAHFMQQMGQHLPGKPWGIHPEALKTLCSYHWPGNIRELENMVERLMHLVSNREITVHDLPQELLRGTVQRSSRLCADAVEAHTVARGIDAALLGDALQRTGGNIRRAAALLGMSRSGFYYKMKCCGLDANTFRHV